MLTYADAVMLTFFAEAYVALVNFFFYILAGFAETSRRQYV